MRSGIRELGRLSRGTLVKLFGIERLTQLVEEQRNILAYTAWLALLRTPKHCHDRALAPHGFKVYSQAEEDGFIHEILRRIGFLNRTFVEIGVSHGRECNTRLLLRQGWQGLWIDGSKEYAREIQEFFSKELQSGQLTFVRDFVTRENVNSLLGSRDWKGDEIDLLSVDIDGNDYHLLRELSVVRPRVVVVEYNSIFAPPVEWIANYDPARCWQGDDDYGASLKSYELLLGEKGYALVGCTLNGTNAFFVRGDLLGDHFVPDTSAEFHYESPRFWLTHAWVQGHGAGTVAF
jgi:hypothetical protein